MPMEVFTDLIAPPPHQDTRTGSTHYMLDQHEAPPPSYYEARYTRPLASINVSSDKSDGEKMKMLSMCY